MLYKLFKRYSLVCGIVIAIPFLILLGKPIQVNAVPSQALGTWGLSDQVPYELRGISMISPVDGWAVGFEGYTENNSEFGSVLLQWNGSAWNRVTSPVSTSLYAVKMISASDVWAVGASGTKLHWDGYSWSDFSCAVFNCVDLYAVDFTSTNDVWAVGFDAFHNGKIERWNGSTWIESSLVPNQMFKSVSVISANDAWSVGRYFMGNLNDYDMLQSHWNGSIWSTSTLNYGTWGLSAVDMISSSEGWAAGNEYICHYTGTWVCAYHYYPTLASLEMLSAMDGWIVGGTSITHSESLGLILHWDGNAWTVIDNPASKALLGIDMLTANEGWAIGWEGIILHYTNYKYTYLPLLIR